MINEFNDTIIHNISDLDSFNISKKILVGGGKNSGKRFLLFSCFKSIFCEQNTNFSNIYILCNHKSYYFWNKLLPQVNFYNNNSDYKFDLFIKQIVENENDSILIIDGLYKYDNIKINKIFNKLKNKNKFDSTNILISSQNINYIDKEILFEFDYFLFSNNLDISILNTIYDLIINKKCINYLDFKKLINQSTCLPYLFLSITHKSFFQEFNAFKISYSCFSYIVSKLGPNYNELKLNPNINLKRIYKKIDYSVYKYKNVTPNLAKFKGKFVLII